MDYVELNIYIRMKGLANSGGSAKQLIRSEAVKLNGVVETRNKKKLVPGDKVSYKDQVFEVKEQDLKKPE